MAGGDYWDIDDFLAEEEPVTVLTSKELRGLGHLCPSLKNQDLPNRHKLDLPYWLAALLVQRNFITVSVPKYYAESYRASLKADPSILQLSEKSKYYFTLGSKLATLLLDTELTPILMQAFMERFRHVVAHQELKKTIALIRSLTELELNLMDSAQKSMKELQEWRQRKYERIKEASVVGMPKKRMRLS
mmetsp:Transcript_23902/g.42314  ORF Transcript_23902/g.42314 Transcript_23902/m.42314 type:complete len:189 (-) Transcript_23902:22-588(-)|eukprot:CAMPEP_0204906664 /NCGR_PEP_ID=MMETSP1397-20131031/6095_1 /ASSEMBLY_ACC=CAM_ASM_000891 /TAXON_ID=49980 /ORGANISM="Climacostomum Climacostomum virens, Strain Stock W-24" /LENGTH=188 /DNA_ID=CAMNT_0052075667 /DNA_START=689 /DNA_END=1255 /DNA_ORIENTATION=-